jgi:putative oxidoreductase
MSILASTISGYRTGTQWLRKASPIADLAVRLWVANVFFTAGLTKIDSWYSTIGLFTYVYHVPLLPPELAAYLGTAVELVLPIFLAVGLFGRLSAGILFFYNIIAVISYPGLSTDGLVLHEMWGIMLLIVLLHGPGKLSLDNLACHYLPRLRAAAC